MQKRKQFRSSEWINRKTEVLSTRIQIRGFRLWIEGSDWSRSDSLTLWGFSLFVYSVFHFLLLLLLQWFQSQDSGVTPNSSPSPTRRFRYTSRQKFFFRLFFTLSFWTHMCLLSCRPAVSATVRWPALTPLKRKGNKTFCTGHELKHNRDASCWCVWSLANSFTPAAAEQHYQYLDVLFSPDGFFIIFTHLLALRQL